MAHRPGAIYKNKATGYKTRLGEKEWVGGRATFAGTAGFRRGDSIAKVKAKRGTLDQARMRASLMAIRNALEGDDNATVMTKVAIELELEYMISPVSESRVRPRARGLQLEISEIHKYALMATHRFVVTALDARATSCIAALADAVRRSLADGQPRGIINTPMPPIAKWLDRLAISAPAEAFDAMTLLQDALCCPLSAKTYLFSEPDAALFALDDCGRFAPPETLASCASHEELLAVVKPRLASCFWCGGPNAVRKVSQCGRCQAVDYCSSECQKKDWKAFHKDECKAIASGKATKASLGLEVQHRVDFLTTKGAVRAKIPHSLGSIGQGEAALYCFPCITKDNRVTAETIIHPHAWLLDPIVDM